jgi:hypothetical protein
MCLLDCQCGKDGLRITPYAVRYQVKHYQCERGDDSSKDHIEMSRICQTEFQEFCKLYPQGNPFFLVGSFTYG